MKRAQLFVFILSGLCAAHAAQTHYHFVRQPKTWHQALKFCRHNYVDLAYVQSQDQNDRLRQLVSRAKVKNAWIGLFDDSAMWKWSLDSTTFNNNKNYKLWKPGNPTMAISSCVTVTQNGYWGNVKCDLGYPSVCYNKTGPTKYFLVNKTMTFYRAKIHCRSLYSGLASIRTQTEQDIIAGLVTTRTWIGLNRRRFRQWSDSQYVKYTNWNKTQADLPDTLQRRCILVNANSGKWLEDRCGNEHHFVCVKRPRVQKLKVKMKFQSSVDMNDPAVTRQIREQIHDRLKNVTSRVKVNWVAANGQDFRKEKKDKWEQSDRFRC